MQSEPEISNHTLALFRKLLAGVAPPPRLTVSQWADDRRMLPETAAEPGSWKTSRTPYLKDVMDACSDPRVRKVVEMFASQLGKSEGQLNTAGYFMDYDPTTLLLIQPTIETAEAYSKERFAPMIRDCPTLAEKVADPKSRDASNTIRRKEYPGGFAVLIGANAPAELASRPMRVVLADEVDRFPLSAGTEGDPLSLAEKRQTTFWNRLTIICSTPTVKGESRIESEYEQSSQEVWCVPCPSCGCYQPYDWQSLVFDTAEMACAFCGCLHNEFDWKAEEGIWIAREDNPVTRGFHLNAMASPWLRWTDLIAEFRDAVEKGVETLKTFVNTRLAEVWEEGGESADEETLETRRHYYNCDVPAEVLILTAGVDVQADRLECEVVGWGYGAESWGVQYAVLPGDPHRSAVWQDLDAFLQRTYSRADGAVLPVSCVCIDSGYATSDVYSFCRPRMTRYVFAIKGQGGPGHPEVGPFSRQGKNKNVAVFPVGTDSSKDTFMARLQVETEGADYCHWPRESELSTGDLRGYGRDYFKGIMAERRVERKNRGRVYHAWVKRSSHSRNEALDCRIYASAALRILNPRWDELGSRRAAVSVDQAAKAKGRRTISPGVKV